ncbi:ABC transporter substrate-binding protein [Alteribacillus bidgolensis]|uniref:Glycine betaine/proline transport system substrate-binding protein n=1 Tax=Alteribacillus bidgolensis TaxID=930129 RepID=A0A1G8RXV6_9BACI|nr:ABC transporter substrate-binding protein [Alteribacillus bidgolensis]SDJ21808.1 glycine betaine/proline transport system substrate-binding protein [Alteribacillus bidgolensis]
MKRFFCLILAVTLTSSLILVGCSNGSGSIANTRVIGTIKFADPGWDSIRVHNEIARIIIEEGYGYKTEVRPGSETASLFAISTGSMDVFMEIWTGSYPDQYGSAIENSEIIEASVNLDDTQQGLYVPTYVIEGDLERGIEPIAPDLESIHDLPEYWELFKDPDNPSKGRIYGAIPGWNAHKVFQEKMENYGLFKTFNYYEPDSQTALNRSLIKLYESGKPWVGYQWEPSWIVGLYDMTKLKDEPYNHKDWLDGYRTEFPSQRLTIAVHKKLPEQVPKVYEFLSNYSTNSEITTNFLAYMEKNDATPHEAAEWFLKEYEEVWTTWVPSDISEKVKAKLK